MKKILVALFLAATVSAPVGAADLDSELKPELDSLEALYVHLHSHPELSNHEFKTAARIADDLESAGYEVTRNVGGTGVVGVMKNGPGRTLLIRADMDALPIVEQSDIPYASTVKTTNDDGAEVGVMHACGHDMHMTSLVGTARMLARLKDEWSGTLVMVGQPAEEAGAGAKSMLDDGLYSRFPTPDYAIALHVNSDMKAGTVGYVPGYALANVDSVDITVRGIGGHGSKPEGTKDPIVVAAQIVLGLQTIVSREVSPLDSAVVTVGSIHGGTRHNIIPDEVHLQLTVRSYADDTRRKVLESIERISINTARALGIPEDHLPIVEASWDEYTPSTYNDPALVGRLVPVLRQLLGTENVIEQKPVMGGEDFSQFGRTTEDVPIFIMWLGVIDEERFSQAQETGVGLPTLHSSMFRPAIHPSIETGVKSMTTAALELLKK
jgi:hippurate hydrolase